MRALLFTTHTTTQTVMLLLAVAWIGALGCDNAPAPTPKPKKLTRAPKITNEPLPAVMTLQSGGTHAPSLMEHVAGEPYTPEVMMAKEECVSCHGTIVQEWSQSMHALGSMNNPIYRVAFDEFLRDKGPQHTTFCGGCHDPAMVMQGTIKALAKPDNKAAHAAITCNACHGVTKATTQGNASYTLTTATIPMPKEHDAASLTAHKARLSTARLSTNTLCVSCHRGFLTPETGHTVPLEGLVEWSQWRDSAWKAASVGRIDPEVTPRDCVSCHMPSTPEGHRSHRFAGGHTSFGSALSKAQLDAHEALLKTGAQVDVLPAFDGERSDSMKGSMVFDVVVFNAQTGHHFPGGARDLRDTWLDVRVTDVATGRVLAQHGQAHEETGAMGDAHIFRVHQTDDKGNAQDAHNVSHFRTPVFDNTIAPRDARVIKYAWKPDAPLKGPINVEATLRHRRITLSMQRIVCKDSKTPRGQAFGKASARFNGVTMDPCAAQPVLDIARHTSAFSAQGALMNTPGDSTLPMWRRHLRHGIGLSHDVQETLHHAQAALEAALKEVVVQGPRIQRARVLLELGKVIGRMGRTKEAIALLDQAQRFAPTSTAPTYQKAKALMKTWKWSQAQALLDAIDHTTDHVAVWRALAISAGAASDPATSLRAAQRGLALEPRSPHLLRAQMLAYSALDAPVAVQNQATEAFNVYKRDVMAPHIKNACSASQAWCKLERAPVHVHWLVKQ